MWQTEHQTDVLTETTTENGYSLIVWNDDVNTFDYVAEALIDICGHTPEQAEQCAIVIDLKGKYAVQHGSYNDMAAKCTLICDRNINATVGEN
jgi:ATP-dependent Clp protease adaptor protein ClpS